MGCVRRCVSYFWTGSEDIAGARVNLLERLAQFGTRLHFERAVDFQPDLAVLRYLDERDGDRDLAGMLLDDVTDLLHEVLADARVRKLEGDLADALVADAVERHDLERVEFRRDRRLGERGGVGGEVGLG